VDLPDYAAARNAGIGALPDMARVRLPGGDRHALMVHVRDENGALVYSATLDLVGTWHAPKAAFWSARLSDWCQVGLGREMCRMAALPRRGQLA
jgi:hypothetical protein